MNMTLALLTIFQISWQPLLTPLPPKVTIITEVAQHEVYSTFMLEVLLVSSDLMCLFFTIDIFTDPLDVTLAREFVDTIIDVILNPTKARPIGELFIGTMVQQ